MCFRVFGTVKDTRNSIVDFGNFCSGNLVTLFDKKILSPSFALHIQKICFCEILVPTYQAVW